MENKEVFNLIISSILSLIIANIGIKFLKDFSDNLYIGFFTILLGFLVLYFYSYSSQIKANKDEIEKISKENEEIKTIINRNEKLLNTIRDIVLLNKNEQKRIKTN